MIKITVPQGTWTYNDPNWVFDSDHQYVNIGLLSDVDNTICLTYREGVLVKFADVPDQILIDLLAAKGYEVTTKQGYK